MNPYNLEIELSKVKVEDLSVLPEVVRSRMNETYDALADIPMNSSLDRKPRKWFRGIVIAASLTLLLAIAVLASGFISPVMAESLKQIPIVNSVFKLAGDLGLKAADEKGLVSNVNLSDSHDGVTLSVPQIIYDGIRVSIALKGNTKLSGSMENLEILIDNKLLFPHKDEWGPIAGIVKKPGVDEYSGIMEFPDPSSQGMGASAFPDQFVLTLKTNMKGSKELFEIDIPVTKNTKDVKVYKPAMKRTHDNLTLTLDKVILTPITTGLNLTIDATSANIPMKYQPSLQWGSYIIHMGFSIIDDQGNELRGVGGSGNNNAKRDVTFEDIQVSPVLSTTKSITIKPFLYQRKDDGSGEAMVDSQGNMTEEYIKEMEMTVPISP